MSTYHRDPLYQRNARIIRNATNKKLATGNTVPCISCGRPIAPGQRYDVGHRIDASRGGTNNLDNLGPQHRRENRQAGGRLGARHTNPKTNRGLPTW